MDTTTALFATCIAIFMAGSFIVLFPKLKFWKKNKSNNASLTDDKQSKQMQLAAYERLLLLVDRIALQNLISREALPNLSCREMQHLLSQNLKQEFEFNITQQIYVSADSWTSIKNLRDQNLLIIHQIAQSLPANATGTDLNKSILEFLANDQRGKLHELVSEVLSFEAKKLL
ncbi:MAG: hypothetical protein ACOVMM_11400 [Chitinophagaceae bacterium]